MKSYLAKFTIYDGEHEHSGQFLVKANSLEEAEEIASSQEHEAEIIDNQDDATFWDYGDGTTSAQLDYIDEITDKEAALLDKLGAAYYFN